MSKEFHGESRTRLYAIYGGMKSRCYNAHRRIYEHYGARGICVCDEWRESYLAFRDWALSNGYADNLTLDRINSDGNYSPENCRWIPQAMQTQNRPSYCIVYDGICLREYCRQNDLNYGRILSRIHDGWNLEDAIKLPKDARRPRCDVR